MTKIIVTAAVTGAIHIPSMSDYLPITPEEIAADAIKAYEAGAAVVHIHARDPKTGQPSSNMDYYKEILRIIREKCDLVICTTTGGGLGMTKEERIKVVPTFSPELASFNMGSINFALYPLAEKITDYKFDWEKKYLEFTEDFVFSNTFKNMKYFFSTMNEYDTRPELEVYDVAMINNAVQLMNEGYLKRPVYLQFVLGILGGLPATVSNLVILHNYAKELIGEFNWSVAAAGRHQLKICAAALAMGGNVRVGLEDSLYASKGILAKSSADQVKKVVNIASELSLEIATPDDARKILGLKGLNKVDF
jgi:uncharacterized protein (DUF849 family)